MMCLMLLTFLSNHVMGQNIQSIPIEDAMKKILQQQNELEDLMGLVVSLRQEIQEEKKQSYIMLNKYVTMKTQFDNQEEKCKADIQKVENSLQLRIDDEVKVKLHKHLTGQLDMDDQLQAVEFGANEVCKSRMDELQTRHSEQLRLLVDQLYDKTCSNCDIERRRCSSQINHLNDILKTKEATIDKIQLNWKAQQSKDDLECAMKVRVAKETCDCTIQIGKMNEVWVQQQQQEVDILEK